MSGIPLNEFWEVDDGERMDGLIRIERFIKSQGVNSAQIWGAWYNIKQLVKAALKYSGAPAEQTDNISRAEICDWKVESDSYYHTTCGEVVQSILDITGIEFCPYCSRKLRPC